MRNIWFALLIPVLALGCFSANSSTLSENSEEGDGEEVKLGTLSSKAPKAWIKEEPSNKLRKDQFRLPKAAGDKEDAELATFYFPGGGSVDENVARWKDKFRTDKGKKVEDFKLDTFKVGKVPVTYLDISGSYVFMVKPPKKDYRMIAVYFDSDDGPFFITVIGPEKTVAAHKKAFDNWLKAFN
jgi:hypothetical protein